MKLNEFLSKVDKNEMVYIGTVRGSGWIIIDTAENLLVKLEEVDEQLKKEAKRIVKDSQKKLDSLPTSIVELQKEIAELKDAKEVKKAKSKLARAETAYATAYNQRALYQKSLDKWMPMGNRLVHDTYEHETDEIGTCVRVSGHEKGKYWSYDEQFKTK